MKTQTYILTLSVALVIALKSQADNRGNITNSDAFDDSALVCMSVGLTAAISGLEDFTLTPISTDGAAGSRYRGTTHFDLESNGQITVLIQGETLSLKRESGADDRISVNYLLDGDLKKLVTLVDDSHQGQHELSAEAILGAISAQKAGTYEGSVTLIVTPTMGGLTGCGESSQHYPSQSAWGTIAFEDLYPTPGDADYNDFVVNFRILEKYDANDHLESITMDFLPIARGAGYNHELMLSLDGMIDSSRNITTQTAAVFGADAEVSATYTRLDSGQSHTRYFDVGEDITVFSNTRAASGAGFFNVSPGTDGELPRWMTQINVSLNADSEVMSSGLMNGDFNYRPYLHVMNTGQDIDIHQVNALDNMIDANGYPFGLLVPSDWQWPAERVSIDSVYPYFSDYRHWLNGESSELSEMGNRWYDYPAPGMDDQLIHVDLSTLTRTSQQ